MTRKGRLIVMNAGWSPVDFRNDIAMIKLDVNLNNREKNFAIEKKIIICIFIYRHQ